MGRELRRVPLNFSLPVGEKWPGFLNPHYVATECAACGHTGLSRAGKILHDRWYGYLPFKPEDRGSTPFLPSHPIIRARAEHNVRSAPQYYARGEAGLLAEARRLCEHFNASWSHHLNAYDVKALVDANRLHDFTHVFTRDRGWQPKEPPRIPTPAEVNEWSINFGIGHDSINQWVVVKAECARLGEPNECAVCGGEGEIWPSAEAKAVYEAWEPTPPPKGEGYQIWETVSEGSPISPVFATPEELARHMEGRKWGADDGQTYDTWMRFIQGPGWAPSLIATDGIVFEGVEGVTMRGTE